MKRKFLSVLLSFVFVLGFVPMVFFGASCDKDKLTVYDLSTVKVEDVIDDYDGTAKVITIGGIVPNGVVYDIKYYDSDKYTQELSALPVDSGVYYAMVTFKEETTDRLLDTMTATVTINKIDFPENLFTFETYRIGEESEEKVQFLQDSNGDYYIEFDESVYRPKIVLNLDNLTKNSASVEYYYKDTFDGKTKRVVSPNDSRLNLSTSKNEIQIKIKIQDENHKNTISAEKKFYMIKKIVNISTKEDLLRLNTDIYEKSVTVRENYIYKLANDIDLSENGDKGVWQTITPSYEPTLSTQPYFCSEFDGNSKTIKNFKINKDSVKYDLTLSSGETVNVDALYRTTPVETFMETYAGFFGFVVGANIHDLNFENVEFDFNFDDILTEGQSQGLNYTASRTFTADAKGHISQILHAGVLCGRGIRSFAGKTMAEACSSFENIHVNGITGKIACSQCDFGGIIGTDVNTDEDGITHSRKNLTVEGLDIIVQFSGIGTGFVNFATGGIVGSTLEENKTTYENCQSSGKIVVLGYSIKDNTKYVSYKKNTFKDSNTQGSYTLNTYGYFCMGGILGRNFHVGNGAETQGEYVKLKDCSSSVNFVVYNYNSKNGAGICFKGTEYLQNPEPARDTSGLCGYDDTRAERRLQEENSQDSCTIDVHLTKNEQYSPEA